MNMLRKNKPLDVDGECPRCRRPMIIRMGVALKNLFVSCIGFGETCDYTRLPDSEETDLWQEMYGEEE